MGNHQSTALIDATDDNYDVLSRTNAEELLRLLADLAEAIHLLERNDVQVAANAAWQQACSKGADRPTTPPANGQEDGNEAMHISMMNVSRSLVAHTPEASRPRKEIIAPFMELYLGSRGIGDDGLRSGVSTAMPRYWMLNLDDSMPMPTPLDVLSRHAHLTVLDLSYNGLTKASVGPLLQALQGMSKLRRLCLAGNPLGSSKSLAAIAATPTPNEALKSTWENEAESQEAPIGEEAAAENESSKTAAELISSWLACNPCVEDLSLFHCGLYDDDVLQIFRGLSNHRNGTLCCLNMAYNVRLTWRTAALALSLVRDGGNDTLAVLLLESAPYDGSTYVVVPPATAVRLEYGCTSNGLFRSGLTYVPFMDQDCSGSASFSAPIAWQSTPGAQLRYKGRSLYLDKELDGAAVMPSQIIRALGSILEPRRKRYLEYLEAATATTPSSLKDSVVAVDEESLVKNANSSDMIQSGKADDTTATEGDDDDDGAENAEDVGAAETLEERARLTEPSLPAAAPSSKLRRPWHLRRTKAKVNASNARMERQQIDHSRLYASHPRRDARLESPERLAVVQMETTEHMRRHRRLSKTEKSWINTAKFVLRPNGIDTVLVPPVLPGGGSLYNSALLIDMPHTKLKPCWCTPNDASSPYAGVLHYHCISEETVSYGVTARRRNQRSDAPTLLPALKKPLAGAKGSRPSKGKLGKVSMQRTVEEEIEAQADAEMAVDRGYHGCRGTGHRCVSEAHDLPSVSPAASLLRSRRSADQKTSPPSRSAATAAPVEGTAAISPHPPITLKRTKHTTLDGLVVTLNYNPVTYFSSAFIPCASPLQLEEYPVN